MMLGLGEGKDEVLQSLRDLRSAGCDFLTLGQYLAPSKLHHPVVEYIHPDVFAEYKTLGEAMGFKFVASAPLVRSSYMAEKALE
jgi:lipoic acid synthetase